MGKRHKVTLSFNACIVSSESRHTEFILSITFVIKLRIIEYL
nr:MAG TPA: hypothetical protein [Caudoviricetes sp.]DAQ99413.1 MAG TPA: hypothetical protein [Caudoviricetes sp.]